MQIKNRPALFSDTLDPETASFVHRIPGQHDRFSTDYVGVDGHVAVRLEAWRSRGGHAWAIDRFTYVPALNRVEKTVEARPGLCFFDALHHCAKFQAAELAGHEDRQFVQVPDDALPDAASWREAAEAASQIIDDAGTVHPCAEGRVLTNGLFSPVSLKTATRTNDQALLPSGTSRPGLARDLLATAQTALVPSGDHIEVYRQKFGVQQKTNGLKRLFNEAVLHGQNLTDGIVRLADNGFQSHIPVLRSCLTLGLAPALGLVSSDARYVPLRHYSLLKHWFDRKVQALPDGPEKTVLLDYARLAESATWLERASRLIEKDRLASRSSDASIRLALDYVERAGQAESLSALDIGRLKSECVEQGLSPLSFSSKLRSAWDAASMLVLSKFHEGMTPETKVGDLMPDDTIFAGMSPTARAPFFAAPQNGFWEDWNEALNRGRMLKNYHGRNGSRQATHKALVSAIRQDVHDHGWRLPSMDELTVLYKNKEFGSLAQSFRSRDGDYWSNESNLISSNGLNFFTGKKVSYNGSPCSTKFVYS